MQRNWRIPRRNLLWWGAPAGLCVATIAGWLRSRDRCAIVRETKGGMGPVAVVEFRVGERLGRELAEADGLSTGTSLLAATLGDRSATMRRAAANELGKMRSLAVRPLMQALPAGEPVAALEGAYALGDLSDAAVPALQLLVSGGADSLFWPEVIALGRAGARHAIASATTPRSRP